MKPEQKMWVKCKRQLDQLGFAFRVENLSTTSCPDVHFIQANGKMIWIELKIASSAKSVLFQKYQIAWYQTAKINQLTSQSALIFVEKDGRILVFDYLQLLRSSVRKVSGGRVRVWLQEDNEPIAYLNRHLDWVTYFA